MTKEQQEFEYLKSDLLNIAEVFTFSVKEITYEQYKDPEFYSKFLQLRNTLMAKGIDFGHFRFKACLERDWLSAFTRK